MAQEKLPCEPQEKNILYVVFHGLISIVENTKKKEFRAYILSMGDEHRYLFGDWLREIDIPAGFAGKLVVGGRKGKHAGHLDASQRPTVHAEKIERETCVDEKHDAIHARILFPQPDRVIYANSGSLALKSGSGALKYPDVKTNAGATVFAYDLKDQTDFYASFLASEHSANKWEADSLSTTTRENTTYRVAALHIFSNPRRATGTDHSLKEFSLSAQVLGAPVLKLARVGMDITAQLAPPPPDGLCRAELLSLPRRDSILQALAEQARQAIEFEISGGGCESCCSAGDGVEP